jgi:hypothetical protein
MTGDISGRIHRYCFDVCAVHLVQFVIQTIKCTKYIYIYINNTLYSVILSVLDPRKCEHLKDYSLHFEHTYMTTIYEHFQHLL